MEWLASPEIWVAFLTLTALEIVLGIDNIIFISILVGRLPPAQQPKARFFGLALAMGTRILLLLSITWVMRLTTDLFHLFGQGISGRDLILFFGGLFLLFKSTMEIYHSLEGAEEEQKSGGKAHGFMGIIVQIAIIDIIFSLDSVITAVGLVQNVPVMVAAIVISVGVMMLAAGTISDFIETPIAEDARPVVPHRGRHRAGGRVLRSARAERLRLLRHGLLPGGGGAEHPLARGHGAQARRSR